MNTAERTARQGLWLAAFLGALVIGSGWLFTQRYWWLSPLASRHGGGMDRVFYITMAITGVLFVLLQLLLAALVTRFRHRGADTPRRLPGRRLERRFALIAGMVILGVDVTLFALGESEWAKAWKPAPSDATLIEVTASQFMWHFRYPGKDGAFGRTNPAGIKPDNPLGLDAADPASRDDVVSANELHLTQDQPVRLRLRSRDVIHSFFVPDFRVKQDLVPGMFIEVWFVPSQAGQFEVACNQLCGMLHHKMRGMVTVEPRDAVDRWLAGMAPQGE